MKGNHRCHSPELGAGSAARGDDAGLVGQDHRLDPVARLTDRERAVTPIVVDLPTPVRILRCLTSEIGLYKPFR